MGTVRVHFTTADLIRTQVAAEPDPFWEIVLSLHVLQGEDPRWRYPEWRRMLPNGEPGAELGRLVRTTLVPLAPAKAAYFPDFLTPLEGLAGFDAGLEAILRTPRRRAREELARMSSAHGGTAWITALAQGGARQWSWLGSALRTYFQLALADFWPTVRARIRAEYALRSRLTADRGIGGLLSGLSPMFRWNQPVLEFRNPSGRDIYLDGRGVTFVPSYFNCRNPLPLWDPELPQVIVFPAARLGGVFEGRDPETGKELPDLIGATRAAILEATAQGRTTTELARAGGVSLATASEHATVLRRAGLIGTQRYGQAVLHTITPLGAALLAGPNRRQGEATTTTQDSSLPRS
jgi:DNA-binding transcriptional ArsR family regulator